MKGMIIEIPGGILYRYDFETVKITACGEDGVRVQAAFGREPSGRAGAIGDESAVDCAEVKLENGMGSVTNGSIEARITEYGFISFFRKGELFLREYARNFIDPQDAHTRSPLQLAAREYRPMPNGKCGVAQRFETLNADERIYGMGQYQHGFLNLKGMNLELMHRNTQSSVPFYLSSEKYGFLWNNPATGNVFFGKDKTEWKCEYGGEIDYWVCVGEDYKQILRRYCGICGFAPQMPEYALGFWQSKMRYQTQEELLSVAREYKRRNLPLSVIVIDFFHWKKQGDWSFDERFWPDPKGMVEELNSLGVKLAVSVWPTVECSSENYGEILQKGLLANVAQGKRMGLDFITDTMFIDVTNPEGAEFLWRTVKKNYYDYGIGTFWLDEAEPEYKFYQPENYIYRSGFACETGNIYPVCYSKTFYDGLKTCGEKEIVNLVRCAWAGSQKYGALVWSGDVNSTFEAMRNQLQIGLNLGMAGIPWWTADIGGFHGGDIHSEEFRELMIRWFEWETFCPVMRLHGDRLPKSPPIAGGVQESGADNEVWSFGTEAYAIFENYLRLRDKMKPYLKKNMQEASESGCPVMRAMFLEFPDDKNCFDAEDQYMFGGDLIVAPVFCEGAAERSVYLPSDCTWVDVWSGKEYCGGQTISACAPLNIIPLFARKGSEVIACFESSKAE